MSGAAISPDDPRTPDVRRMLARHLEFAAEHSPVEDRHALDVTGLLEPDVSFFSYRRDGELLAIGALKALDADHVEVKSMHTAESARGRGVGRTMVEHLLAVARARGFRRVSIETGTMAAFAPARALYTAAGFEPCPPFGAYVDSPNSTWMTRELEAEDEP